MMKMEHIQAVQMMGLGLNNSAWKINKIILMKLINV